MNEQEQEMLYESAADEISEDEQASEQASQDSQEASDQDGKEASDKKEGKKAKRKEYPKLKSIEDIPESRSQLSHDWMLDYAQANGTPEQCAILLDFIEKNQVLRESHLKKCKGVTFYITDIKPMRNLFCDMFFPALKEYKSKPKSEETQLEKAKRMLAEKAAQAKATKATPKARATGNRKK